MRKLSLLLTLGAATFILGTGCLKDKGFDAQDYGMRIQEKKAVMFPLSSSSPVAVGVTAQATPLTIDGPAITVEHSGGAATDVHVTIAQKPTLVTDAGLTPLPAGSVTISTLTPTISAGQKLTEAVKLTFPNSAALDPTKSYGLGLTITTVDQGYIIASNQKDVLFTFSVKNKYDGVYKLTLTTSGWGAYGIGDGVSAVYPPDMELITAGANAVTLNALPPSTGANLQPGWAGGVGSITGYTVFGATAPKYSFDVATNNAISVVNTLPDDGRARTLFLNPASTISKYDPVSKTITLEYFMTQTGRPNQTIKTVYSYLRPR